MFTKKEEWLGRSVVRVRSAPSCVLCVSAREFGRAKRRLRANVNEKGRGSGEPRDRAAEGRPGGAAEELSEISVGGRGREVGEGAAKGGAAVCAVSIESLRSGWARGWSFC